VQFTHRRLNEAESPEALYGFEHDALGGIKEEAIGHILRPYFFNHLAGQGRLMKYLSLFTSLQILTRYVHKKIAIPEILLKRFKPLLYNKFSFL
jgi:hypothetical protein